MIGSFSFFLGILMTARLDLTFFGCEPCVPSSMSSDSSSSSCYSISSSPSSPSESLTESFMISKPAPALISQSFY
jgi:hypothetical protein